jgi:hypothetical protein
MHRASLTVKVAIPLILLAAATVVISALITEDVVARDGGRYSGDASQAASISNDCLNPVLDSNTIDNMVGVGNCGGTVLQQDESGQAGATTTHQTANPTIELQRSTTQTPLVGIGDCAACFNPLTDAQLLEYEAILENRSVRAFGTSVTTIEELCTLLRNIALQGDPIEAIELATGMLEDVQGLRSGTISDITTCLIKAVE